MLSSAVPERHHTVITMAMKLVLACGVAAGEISCVERCVASVNGDLDLLLS